MLRGTGWLAFALALACAGGKDGATDDPATGENSGDNAGTDNSGTDNSGSDNSGKENSGGDSSPQIVSFGTNVTSMTEGDSLVFTAVVTDPDGIDDLIGGSLESEGGATYGAFATSGEEGSYSLTLTWDQINTVQAIEFDKGTTRGFVARFYDQAAHETSESASVDLTCNGEAACDGHCVSLESDLSNCGQCGTTCDACSAGVCYAWSDCYTTREHRSCDEACGAQGSVCEDKCDGGYGTKEPWGACPDGTGYIYACSDRLGDEGGEVDYMCCCRV